MRFSAVRLLLCIFMIGLAAGSLQAQDKMVYAGRATSKFVNFPGLPTCLTGSVQNGDPTKGAAVILAKLSAGCTVPWHWHTADEQLMMVTGTGKAAMKEGSPTTIHAGDYLSLPGKGVHKFTCVAACTFFLAPSGAFDIHYVNAEGKEISPEEALKAKSKAPMKKDMKM